MPEGVHTIDVRRLGYAPLFAPIKVGGTDTVEVVLLLQPSERVLPTVHVTDSNTSPWLSEFERRRRSSTGGHFLTQEQINASFGSRLSDFMQKTIPGVTVVQPSPIEAHVFSTRGASSLRGGCQVAVFLDGVRVSDGNAALAPLETLGGIEYYSPGFVPVQYKTPGEPVKGAGSGPGSAACGVLLLWRR